MIQSSAKSALLKLELLAFILMTFISIPGQKSEHYNSPLYAPKTYDPTQTSSSGLPDALKTIGIEQKLGAELPLDTEFKDEDGKVIRLGEYFNKGRPVILAFAVLNAEKENRGDYRDSKRDTDDDQVVIQIVNLPRKG